jgi:Ca-activated chloride channel homolog
MMKLNTMAAMAVLGMVSTSWMVWAWTKPNTPVVAGGKGSALVVSPAVAVVPTTLTNTATFEPNFDVGKLVRVEGRVDRSHWASVSNGGAREVNMLVTITSSEIAEIKNKMPVHVALVLDRSGSMAGTRLQNAIKAAKAMVERLDSHDRFSLITYDDQAEIMVPPTDVTPGNRSAIIQKIDRITARGSTCISCGLEAAFRVLGNSVGLVNRMMLLSDGEPTMGVHTVQGFQAIAKRASSSEIPISSIGVDVNYNDKILVALAQQSNGHHYFVPDAEGLRRAFDEEAKLLGDMVASNASVTFRLAPGIEMVEVADRSVHHNSDGDWEVQLGPIATAQTKTILMRVRLPAVLPKGKAVIAHTTLNYQDKASPTPTECKGDFFVTVGDVDEPTIDPAVGARMDRIKTARVLSESNTFLNRGEFGSAFRVLNEQLVHLRIQQSNLSRLPKSWEKRRVLLDSDFQLQSAAVSKAIKEFQEAKVQKANGVPVQTNRAAQSQLKANRKVMMDFAY